MRMMGVPFTTNKACHGNLSDAVYIRILKIWQYFNLVGHQCGGGLKYKPMVHVELNLAYFNLPGQIFMPYLILL